MRSGAATVAAAGAACAALELDNDNRANEKKSEQRRCALEAAEVGPGPDNHSQADFDNHANQYNPNNGANRRRRPIPHSREGVPSLKGGRTDGRSFPTPSPAVAPGKQWVRLKSN